MFCPHTATQFVTEFVGFVPGGSGSAECSMVFGNHNDRAKKECLNNIGIIRCPIVGLLCIGRNVYGDWDWTVVEGVFICGCFEELSFC
jgi:hypothetical protein